MQEGRVEVYEGRMEFDGFGHIFLPDAETSVGEVPSIGSWLEENTVGSDDKGVIQTRRIRITVELLG
jgi:hypothetical protein